MSTIPTPADRLTQATANHILDLVRAYADAERSYGERLGDMSPGNLDRCKQARRDADDAHEAMARAVYDLVDWRAVVEEQRQARLAAGVAQDGDR
jgi:hypothetical protein